MKKVLFAIAAVFAIFTSSTLMAQNFMHQDISIFPKPQAGVTQWVINVPHSENDDQKKVEIYVGKTQEVDKCNNHILTGSFETKPLEGWGYEYLVFTTNGNIMATQMGCMDNTKAAKFIMAQPQVMRYNGRLPIIVYAPEGYEVKYKIYKAEPEFYKAGEVRQKK